MSDFNDSFLYRVCADYVDQVWEHVEKEKVSCSDLSYRSGISEERINDLMEHPDTLTVDEAIKLSGAFGLKCGLILYNDGDYANVNGPITTKFFVECWERQRVDYAEKFDYWCAECSVGFYSCSYEGVKHDSDPRHIGHHVYDHLKILNKVDCEPLYLVTMAGLDINDG